MPAANKFDQPRPPQRPGKLLLLGMQRRQQRARIGIRSRQTNRHTCSEARVIEPERQRKQIVSQTSDASGLSHAGAPPRRIARPAVSCLPPHSSRNGRPRVERTRIQPRRLPAARALTHWPPGRADSRRCQPRNRTLAEVHGLLPAPPALPARSSCGPHCRAGPRRAHARLRSGSAARPSGTPGRDRPCDFLP